MLDPRSWLAKALGHSGGREQPTTDLDRRIEAFGTRLEHLPFESLRLMAVRPNDPESVLLARRRAADEVLQAGRNERLEGVRRGIESFVANALDSHAYDPTALGLAWRHEPLLPEDRRALLGALQDVALAVVAQDLVDDETYDQLVGGCVVLVG